MKKVITNNKIHQLVNIDMIDPITPIYIAYSDKFIGMIVEDKGGWRASAPLEWLTAKTFDSRKELINKYSSYDYFVMD